MQTHETSGNTHGKKVILSGIQPSSHLTLGNYLGALKNWVLLQKDYNCYFVAVDLHTITVRQDPKALREQTYLTLATYLASGIDPQNAAIFVQSHVSEHAELGWILNCFAYMGELNRMTQFKDKSAKQGQNIPVGLFTYPTLMAGDILLYQTHLVPVGEDQRQHLEITRDLALRMNHIYGDDLFVIPEVYNPPVGARIMSLQDPTSKMSKSDPNLNGSIFLLDSSDDILRKMKRAVTDSGSEITYEEQKPGVRNLINIQAAILNQKPEAIVAQYAGKQYGQFKMDTAEIVATAVRPLREQTLKLMSDLSYLDSVLAQGAEKARIKAAITLSRVYDRVGFIPRSHSRPRMPEPKMCEKEK